MATKQTNQEKEMSFLDHLEDLRWHLIRSALAVIVAGFGAFLAKSIIFDIILFGPKQSDFFTYEVLCYLSKSIGVNESFCFEELPFRIQSRKMSGQFSAHLWTSITAGFIIAFPYVLYQFWSFVSPGLYSGEKRQSRIFIFFSSILFFAGVIFGYYVICPLSINFLGGYQVSSEIFNDIDIGSYIGLVRACTLASGLIFELPIVIYYLTKFEIVTPDFLKKNRKYAIVIILIISAIITPPDVASQIIVTIPVVILYEVSLIIAKRIYKKQIKKNDRPGR